MTLPSLPDNLTPQQAGELFAVLLKYAERRVKERKVEAARDFDARLAPGSKTPVKATLNGHPVELGYVSKSDPPPRVNISDPEAWIDWLILNRPTEVTETHYPAEVIPEQHIPARTVRNWADAYLKGCKINPLGDIQTPNGDINPDGLTITRGNPVVSIHDNPQVIQAVWDQYQHLMGRVLDTGREPLTIDAQEQS